MTPPPVVRAIVRPSTDVSQQQIRPPQTARRAAPETGFLIRAALAGGAIAGALDIADVLIFHGVRGVAPHRVLQAVASGLLGGQAFAGGMGAASLGLGLHFVIAFGAAATYAVASLRLPILRTRPFLCGPVYGLAVHAVMQLVVLPLSAFRAGPAPPPGTTDWNLVNLLLAHVFFVGLPIALAARWAARRQLPI